MHKNLLIITLILFCCVETGNTTAFASEVNTVAFNGYEPMVVPKSFEPDYSCLTMGEMIAMIAGAVVGGASADFMLGHAPFAIVGIVAGAAAGSLLYRFGL